MMANMQVFSDLGISKKKAQFAWLGLIISILVFAAISVICVFMVWYLTGQDDIDTSAAIVAIDRGLALDIITSKEQSNSLWLILDSGELKSQNEQVLVDRISGELADLKSACVLINSRDYASGVTFELIKTNPQNCKSNYFVALPNSFAMVGLEVPK
jgi:hypothetical protein